MTTKIEIINGLIARGHLSEKPTNFSRKNLNNLIKQALKSAGCNILIVNIPTHSTPRDGTDIEEIDVDHIFETLLEFGSPQGDPEKITPNVYIAYACDANDIARQLDHMCIDKNIIRVTYYPIASPLVFQNIQNTFTRNKNYVIRNKNYVPEDVVIIDNSGMLSGAIVIVIFLFFLISILLPRGIY